MDWQQTLSLGIVALCAGMFIYGAVRKKKHPSASTCGSCADCSAGKTTIIK